MKADTGIVTVDDLLEVNKHTYRLLSDPKAKPKGLPGFEFIRYNFDKTSHHGGAAYYHEGSGTVVLGHRGSATAKDWLVTDTGILLGKKQTKADVAAVDFAESVMAELASNKKLISGVVETGHSKGGRESQAVTAHLASKGIIPCVGLTFNSAMISKKTKLPDIDYDHVNLRMTGGGLFKTDVVSSVGTQLGKNADFPNPEVKNFIQAHLLGSFDSGLKRLSEIGGMAVHDLIASCKKGLSIPQINEQAMAKKSTTEIVREHHPAPEILGTNMPSTKGKIVGETATESIQRLGEGSRFFKIHDKSKLASIPKVGDTVQITYSSGSIKAAVKSIGHQRVNTR